MIRDEQQNLTFCTLEQPNYLKPTILKNTQNVY